MRRTRLLAKEYDARESNRQRVMRLHREWMALEDSIRAKHFGARR